MKLRAVFLIKSMMKTFVGLRITRAAAALSYGLTMTIFPFLICAAAILGSLHLNESDFLLILTDIVPEAALSVVTDFLDYVSGSQMRVMLSVGITAMITTSAAAFRSFTGIMGDIQGKMRFTGIWGLIFSFIFSVVFLVAIYISGLVILSGEWLMQILRLNFALGDVFASLAWLRFVVLFILLFGIIYGMYMVSAPKETKKTHRLPGAVAASFAIVVTSIIYSRMISASIRHTLLYGSLASIIIMMVWLYTCGIILIMGNVFNISLKDMRREFGGDAR